METCETPRRCYRCEACRQYVVAADGKKLLCDAPVNADSKPVNGADIADLADFMFLGGCRFGEALGVFWSDLTLRGDDLHWATVCLMNCCCLASGQVRRI